MQKGSLSEFLRRPHPRKAAIWNRWRRMTGRPRLDLSWADLSDADLYRANLSDADLSEADLYRADLSDADLSWAVLHRANLSEADLYRANLRRADLSGAGLSDADLCVANLSDADLSWANLSDANLCGADLSDADLSEADLSWADLSEADLYRADLYRADLYRANLSEADLYRANLSGANLTGTCLDPRNPCSASDAVVAALAKRGIVPNPRGEFVAYRTQRSQFVGDTVYMPGRTYHAPVFSTDEDTECHPGMYFGSRLEALELSPDIVRVVTNIRHVVVAMGKLRCRRFRLVGADGGTY